MRDWFPLSTYSAFTTSWISFRGPSRLGLECVQLPSQLRRLHLLVVNRRTHEWIPLFRFFDYERFMRDVTVITDTARGKSAYRGVSWRWLFCAIFSADKAPKGFPVSQIINLFPAHLGKSGQRQK